MLRGSIWQAFGKHLAGGRTPSFLCSLRSGIISKNKSGNPDLKMSAYCSAKTLGS